MSKLVLKVYYGEWKNASRDKRELALCKELGARVLVMAKGEPKDRPQKNVVDGFDVLHFSGYPLGERIPKVINQSISLFRWAGYINKLQPDIITGHDLPALLIAWVSNYFRKEKAILVYDSHEFELGRNVQRGWLKQQLVRWCEDFLIRRVAFSIMVNDQIADEVQKEYQLKNRPLVIRSTPDFWSIDKELCAEKRRELLLQMADPKGMVLMYHGALMKGRGIETLLKLVSINSEVCAVVLGNGSEEYRTGLYDLAKEYGVVSRVVFHPAVHIEELWKYVGAVDVGMILAPANCKNHYYSLPNKFFENIQSETPVVCPNYPAMASVAHKYNIGLTCDPTNIETVNACVEKLRTDKIFYWQCKDNLKIAKQDLCWENEKRQLMDAYQRIMQ